MLLLFCPLTIDFFSYTEMELLCRSRSSNTDLYNILSAAYIGKAGSNLEGFDDGEDVLFGVFSRSVTVESDQPGRDSALCLYSITDINNKIKKGLQDCFNSKGTQGLKFLSEDRSCDETPVRIFKLF